MLKSIDISKASGPDKISGRMLKATADGIATHIAMILNRSIETEVFPRSWKYSLQLSQFQNLPTNVVLATIPTNITVVSAC